jgi:opacity protein-like surface antigen
MRRSAVLAAASVSALVLSTTGVLADGYAQRSAAPPPFSWTGMYIGYHAGAAIGSAQFSDPIGPSLFGDTVRTPGSLAGVQAGANAQSGSTVFGIELDLSLADLDGTNTCFAASALYVSSNCHVRTNYMGTLTGRLGVAVGPQGRTLLYGKAGAAFESSQLSAQPNFNGTLFFPPSSVNNGPKFGWTVGGGVEHALAGNWSVKAEYDYLAFGDTKFSVPVSVVPGPALFAPAAGSNVSQDIHQFKVGVNYKLGGDPRAVDPVWAHQGSIKDPTVRPAPGLEVEIGGRYAYGWGRFQKDIGLTKTIGAPQNLLISRLTYDDMNTNSGEVFARVDTPWNLMAKGFVGGGSGKSGRLNDEDWGIGGALLLYSNTLSQPVKDDITYGAIDVGYDWLRGRGYKLASFIGYTQITSDMSAFGCTPISAGNCVPPVPSTGSAIITEKDTWQALRLGSAAQFMIMPGLRADVDAAYLAYVDFRGTDHHFLGNTGILFETFPEKGTGRGVQLEGMLSYDVTNSISFGVGGRYWAMWTTEGSVNCTFGAPCAPVPTPAQHFRAAMEQASVLVQATYRFGADPVVVGPIK